MRATEQADLPPGAWGEAGQFWRLRAGLSLVALAIGCVGSAVPVKAEQVAAPPSASQSDDRQIVVIGTRTIIAELKDVEVERTYDADTIATYAFSTVNEVLDQLAQENGDSDPSVLVNGQRVSGGNDIGDYPVESIARIEVLPPGTASRIGGSPGQRAYNVVLKRRFRNLTLTASRQMATEGGWANNRGEALFSLIKGQDRLNLAFRAADSGALLERDRNIIPLPEGAPYSALGNVQPLSGTEIDPALSLLVGQPVSTVALTTYSSRPALANLLAGANRTNPSLLSNYRSLRGASRTYEVSLSGAKQLSEWLTAAINGRVSWGDYSGQNGLPTARFQLPQGNAFSPFGKAVLIAVNDPTRIMRNVNSNQGQNLTGTFNLNTNDWRVTLVARVDRRTRTYSYDQLTPVSGGFYTLDLTTNPFTGNLGSQIALGERSIRTWTLVRELSEDAEGPLFKLPAGPVRLRVGAGGVWSSLEATDSAGISSSSYFRHDIALRAGLTIPLTGPSSPALAKLGSSELSIDVGRTALGQFGKVSRQAYLLNWQPVRVVRLSVSRIIEGRPITPELAAAPSQEYTNVRFYDPLLNETAVVTTIYGGGGDLRNETYRTDRLSLSASPFKQNLLQFNMDYTATQVRNPIGALPPPSAAIVDAFPERFQRDGAGHLIRVDGRTVNFERQSSRELRTALDMTIPLFGMSTVANGTKPGLAPGSKSASRSGPFARPTLQLHAAHNWLIDNTMIIRAGLPSVDLLDGGAIGLGGGRPRHTLDGSLALASGGTGIRLSGIWRGSNKLRVGTATAPNQLTFKSYATFDLKLFADLGALMPGNVLTKGARLSVSAENLTNRRQQVVDSGGLVPSSFQPAYRDPLGRTLTVELRKAF